MGNPVAEIEGKTGEKECFGREFEKVLLHFSPFSVLTPRENGRRLPLALSVRWRTRRLSEFSPGRSVIWFFCRNYSGCWRSAISDASWDEGRARQSQV
jgi:hypothetical protein